MTMLKKNLWKSHDYNIVYITVYILRYKQTGSSFIHSKIALLIFNVSSQIDTSLIREIEDAYLARYIPVYGDRIATRRYCLDKQKRKEDKSSRMSLLEKLQKKMRTATASHGEESEEEPWPARKASYDRSKNARKSSRKI